MLVCGRAFGNFIICGDSVNFNGPLKSLFRSLAFMEISFVIIVQDAPRYRVKLNCVLFFCCVMRPIKNN